MTNQAVLQYQHQKPAIDPVAKFHACRTLRILGPLCTIAGFGPGLAFVILERNAIALRELWPMLIFAGGFGLLGGSGVIYWLCGIHIRRNSRAAAMIALVLAWVHHTFFLLCFIVSLVATFAGAWRNLWLAALALMPTIMSGLFMLGLLDLIRHLQRCVRSFTHLPHAA